MFKLFNLFKSNYMDSPSIKNSQGRESSGWQQKSDNPQKSIPEGILNEIIDLKLDIIISTIRKHQEDNVRLEKENYKKADKYISDGNYKAAAEITQQDVIGYYTTYVDAQSEEQKNNLLRAAEIYWFNIYHNGTIAPGNYDRLLILLRRLSMPEMELKIAELYLHFAKPQKKESIKKRIENIRKKLRE